MLRSPAAAPPPHDDEQGHQSNYDDDARIDNENTLAELDLSGRRTCGGGVMVWPRIVTKPISHTGLALTLRVLLAPPGATRWTMPIVSAVPPVGPERLAMCPPVLT
jgi:hypothetical protein